MAEEDDKLGGYYVADEDNYEEQLCGSEYPGGDDTHEAKEDCSELEHKDDGENWHYVAEEDYYEEEDLYGNEYPGTNDNYADEHSELVEEHGAQDMELEDIDPVMWYYGGSIPATPAKQIYRFTGASPSLSSSTIVH
ncbi:hypothetical protein H0H87_003795, partial [Tephrocybe sp. NHM501043]